MPDGGEGGPRDHGSRLPSGTADGNDAAELASELHALYQKIAALDHRYAIRAAIHISNTFYDEIAAERGVDPIKFRFDQRNYLLKVIAKEINADGLTLIAVQLADDLSAIDIERVYLLGSYEQKLQEVKRLNRGKSLAWRRIYDILQLDL